VARVEGDDVVVVVGREGAWIDGIPNLATTITSLSTLIVAIAAAAISPQTQVLGV